MPTSSYICALELMNVFSEQIDNGKKKIIPMSTFITLLEAVDNIPGEYEFLHRLHIAYGRPIVISKFHYMQSRLHRHC